MKMLYSAVWRETALCLWMDLREIGRFICHTPNSDSNYSIPPCSSLWRYDRWPVNGGGRNDMKGKQVTKPGTSNIGKNSWRKIQFKISALSKYHVMSQMSELGWMPEWTGGGSGPCTHEHGREQDNDSWEHVLKCVFIHRQSGIVQRQNRRLLRDIQWKKRYQNKTFLYNSPPSTWRQDRTEHSAVGWARTRLSGGCWATETFSFQLTFSKMCPKPKKQHPHHLLVKTRTQAGIVLVMCRASQFS